MSTTNGTAVKPATQNGGGNGKNNLTTNGEKPANNIMDKVHIVRPLHDLPKKVEETKPAPAATELPITDVEMQRLRLENLTALFEKRDKLMESRKNILSYKLAADEDTNSLELKDGKGGKTFKTSNPVVIGEIITLLTTTLEKKMSETDQQIKAS